MPTCPFDFLDTNPVPRGCFSSAWESSGNYVRRTRKKHFRHSVNLLFYSFVGYALTQPRFIIFSPSHLLSTTTLSPFPLPTFSRRLHTNHLFWLTDQRYYSRVPSTLTTTSPIPFISTAPALIGISKMSSPSVQVQPQPSGAKGVSHTTKEAGAMNFDIVRCSRCQRSMSLENESSPGVVRFGMNSYYCSRCASMVGFIR